MCLSTRRLRISAAKIGAPEAHGLAANVDPAFSQQILGVPTRQGSPIACLVVFHTSAEMTYALRPARSWGSWTGIGGPWKPADSLAPPTGIFHEVSAYCRAAGPLSSQEKFQ